MSDQSSSDPPSVIEITGAEGVVKWFDPRKGFGFIFGPDGQDIFTHFSVIEGDGFRALRDGSTVNYDAIKQDDRWRATRVRKLPEPPVPEVIITPEVIIPPKVIIPEKRGYTRSPRA